MCVWNYFLGYITASRKGRVLGRAHPSWWLDRGVPFPEVLVTHQLHQQFTRAVLPLPSLCSVRRDVCHSDVWQWCCVSKICIYPVTGGVSVVCACFYFISFVNCFFCPLSPLRVFCTGRFVLFLLVGRNSSGIGRNDLSESQVSSLGLCLFLFVAFVLTFVVVPDFLILVQIHGSVFS